MNIFNKVTLQSLKKNRTRTIVTIIGIILSAAMICAVTTFASSIYNYALDNDMIDVFYLTKIYDADLAKQVLNNPTHYTYFPKNTDKFFISPEWKSEQMFYPQNVLPAEKTLTTSMFFKYNRVR